MSDNDIKKGLIVKSGCDFFVCTAEKISGDASEAEANCKPAECNINPQAGTAECNTTDEETDNALVIKNGAYAFVNTTYSEVYGYVKELPDGSAGFIIDENDDAKKLNPLYQKDLNYYVKNIEMCSDSTFNFGQIPDAPADIPVKGLPNAVVKISDVDIPLFTIPSEPVIAQKLTGWLKEEAMKSMILNFGEVVFIYYPNFKGNKKIKAEAEQMAEDFKNNGIYAYPMAISGNVYKIDDNKLDAKLTQERQTSLTLAYIPQKVFGKKELPKLEGDVEKINELRTYVFNDIIAPLIDKKNIGALLALYNNYLFVADRKSYAD